MLQSQFTGSCIIHRHFCHASLAVCSGKRRHQSPEWTILSHVSCFVQGEVYWILGLAG